MSIPYIASDPENKQWLGKAVGTGQCVAYVQAVSTAPQTSLWQRGALVKGNDNIQYGTVVATFGPSGKYENRMDGTSHAAVYLKQDTTAITVVDQWSNQPAHRRLIRFVVPPTALAVNNGNMYYVVE
jgi:hypothetical protein